MVIPTDGMSITQDTVFDAGVYYLPHGISIDADQVTLDGNGALLLGHQRGGRGVTVRNRKGITLKNLHVQEYYHGIHAQSCQNLTIANCRVTSTAEVAANTIFLNIWLQAGQAYGGGILLHAVEDSLLRENDLQHQMNGLLSYGCTRLTVQANNASYCSGYGIHLFETSHSMYEDNCADYCCRWQPRGGRSGHMGADATGFLIAYSSSHNIFRRNLARLGGDGFFLAGLTPQFERVPCNHNLFEENDASYSPNIAFEGTFSAGNIYRNNYANHCNYGFWLGFSRDCLIEDNEMIGNVQAGIATENGFNFQVRRNTFRDNNHGVMLWSKHIPEFVNAVPDNTTSYGWTIEANEFIHNNKAVRIAANQDHGIRPYKVPEGESVATWLRPHSHTIRDNHFRDNRIAVESLHTDGLVVEANTLESHPHADLIQTVA